MIFIMDLFISQEQLLMLKKARFFLEQGFLKGIYDLNDSILIQNIFNTLLDIEKQKMPKTTQLQFKKYIPFKSSPLKQSWGPIN